MQDSDCCDSGNCCDVGGCCGENNINEHYHYEILRQTTIQDFMSEFNLTDSAFDEYLEKENKINQILLIERLRKLVFSIDDDILMLPNVFSNQDLYKEVYALYNKANSLFESKLDEFYSKRNGGTDANL